MIEKQYHIMSNTGFARPARMLVSTSAKYLSKLVLEYEGIAVELDYSAQSILDVMSLGIRPGVPFHIRAEGIDAYQAFRSIEDHFSKMKVISSV
ncbi:phosphocarrier protein [Bacillus niacini]|uniref:Phosphocarrier protein n=1 Tax=Neobacillus niacini TaxID=86668 RepID=A0A852T927_9BACI|nr:HPr family phosphocarrier protein [Neobacillus niacini]NYE04297.1 phosphocarrier protein [Neobacillus niacini]